MKIMRQYWTEENLPVLQVGSDFESKNLNFLEELAVCCKGEIDEDVCLALNDWLVKPTIASHGIPLNINGDAKHGLKLQIVYVDKIIYLPLQVPSSCSCLRMQEKIYRVDLQDIQSIQMTDRMLKRQWLSCQRKQDMSCLK